MPKNKRKTIQWTILSQKEISVEERECNWDESFPSTFSEHGEEESELTEELQRKENLAKLKSYVDRMAYRPVAPSKYKTRERTESLAKPKRFGLIANYEDFGDVSEPPERGERMKALAAGFRTMPPEDFEKFHKAEIEKKIKKNKISKRKEQIFYELSAKLEKQSRTQYLNAIINKFGDFVAEMATTMNIPPQLSEPYARMQRGIFYNIVCALGIRPPCEAAYYYYTEDANDYESIHKCAHALLCLIIKALDAAAMKNPADMPSMDAEPDMDSYIKERLTVAAAKKLAHCNERKQCANINCAEKRLSKCDKSVNLDSCSDI